MKRSFVVRVEGQSFTVVVKPSEGGFRVSVDDVPVELDVYFIDNSGVGSFVLEGEAFEALVRGKDGKYTVFLEGLPFDVTVEDSRAALMAGLGQRPAVEAAAKEVKAPMPGLIVEVGVQAGQQIERGQSVAILQAMKMENHLPAPRSGRVREVRVQAGQTVEVGQVLLVLE